MLDPQLTGNVGLYYCCYRLSLMGWNVMPTARNARGVDIIAYSRDATRFVEIQVKALSKRNPVPLGTSLKKVMGDLWVIVNKVASSLLRSSYFPPRYERALIAERRTVACLSGFSLLTTTKNSFVRRGSESVMGSQGPTHHTTDLREKAAQAGEFNRWELKLLYLTRIDK